MGHKVHPCVYRLGVVKQWPSTWFARAKDYRTFMMEDYKIRRYILKKYKSAGVASVEIERSSSDEIIINIHTAKPGIIISRGGTGVEELNGFIQKNLLTAKRAVRVNIIEVKRPALSAQIVADGMVADLLRRLPYRRVLKQTLQRVMDSGALGVKVQIAGRLNGVEIARTEKLSAGKIPLSTLRSNIDFGRSEARMTYGVLGVKAWIYKGDIFDERQKT